MTARAEARTGPEVDVIMGLLQPVHTQKGNKTFISDGIAVRRTVRRAGRQRCLAVQVTHAGHKLTTYQ